MNFTLLGLNDTPEAVMSYVLVYSFIFNLAFIMVS